MYVVFFHMFLNVWNIEYIVIVEHLCWRYAIYVNLRKYILVI